MLKMASQYADGWLPPVPKLGMDVYRFVISTLRRREAEIQRREPVKVKFNGTVKEIAESIDTFLQMGCDGAFLARTPYEEILPAMKRLAQDIAPSYR